MTKRELLTKLEGLLNEKGMSRIDGVTANSTKATIQEAIDCLEASDAELENRLELVRSEWANIASTVEKNGNWLTHSHNRLFIYSSAKHLINK